MGVLFISLCSRSFIGRREGVLSSVKQHHFTQQRAEPMVSNCFLLPPSLLSSPAGFTPRCTRRPSSPTSARTALRPSPTPPTWLSTSVSTQGPSPTTAPTARRPSASSPTSSSTHESTLVIDHTNVHTRAVRRLSHNSPICSLTDGSTTKINPSSATTVTEHIQTQPLSRLTYLHTQ